MKTKLKATDIGFWILITLAISVILWMLHGSPTLEGGIISIGVFIISTEMLIWKKFFEIDKNTAISFAKVKNDLDNKFDKVQNELTSIKDLLKKK
tara:strand:+ start:1809 stop:2093 length:285 start_codon:yes stop_codon:yes gene_type:complete